MSRSIISGATYFLTMFVLGFLLGTLRVLLVAPRLGEWGAIFVELPIMLGISWIVCRWILLRFAVPQRTAQGLVMGAVAFVLLMIAELLLGTSLFDRTLPQQGQAMTSGAGLAGLLGQFAFAVFPLIQVRQVARQMAA